MDLLLDSNHDLVFTNGSCPVTASRADSIAQRLNIKLLTFLGEWFLDTEYGVPYITEVLGKPRKQSSIDSIMQKAILEEEGVLSIVEFSSSLSNTREYSLTFRAKVDDGSTTDTITIGVG